MLDLQLGHSSGGRWAPKLLNRQLHRQSGNSRNIEAFGFNGRRSSLSSCRTFSPDRLGVPRRVGRTWRCVRGQQVPLSHDRANGAYGRAPPTSTLELRHRCLSPASASWIASRPVRRQSISRTSAPIKTASPTATMIKNRRLIRRSRKLTKNGQPRVRAYP